MKDKLIELYEKNIKVMDNLIETIKEHNRQMNDAIAKSKKMLGEK